MARGWGMRTLGVVAAPAGALAWALAAPPAAAQGCDGATGLAPQQVLVTDCPIRFHRPTCTGGVRLHYADPADPQGIDRYACVGSPAGGSSLPLVVFLHPSQVNSVDNVFGGDGVHLVPSTDLLANAPSYPLVAGRTGYVLLMPQGRCLTAPPGTSGPGSHFDYWYRDRDSNLDVRAIRAFIDQVKSRQTLDDAGNPIPLDPAIATVDSRHVYLMGWSNGAFMAHLLMLQFPFEFAALATDAGADPFRDGGCDSAYPSALRKTPLAVVHASCDPTVLCGDVEAWFATLEGLGWGRRDQLRDIITDQSHVQQLGSCSQLSATLQRACSPSAHGFANPQLGTLLQFLGGWSLP